MHGPAVRRRQGNPGADLGYHLAGRRHQGLGVVLAEHHDRQVGTGAIDDGPHLCRPVEVVGASEPGGDAPLLDDVDERRLEYALGEGPDALRQRVPDDDHAQRLGDGGHTDVRVSLRMSGRGVPARERSAAGRRRCRLRPPRSGGDRAPASRRRSSLVSPTRSSTQTTGSKTASETVRRRPSGCVSDDRFSSGAYSRLQRRSLRRSTTRTRPAGMPRRPGGRPSPGFSGRLTRRRAFLGVGGHLRTGSR